MNQICPKCEKQTTVSIVSEPAINGERPPDYFRCLDCDLNWGQEEAISNHIKILEEKLKQIRKHKKE